jgi:hypothetical protein
VTAVVVALGLAVVGVTLLDVVWTTLAAGSGSGPITDRVTAVLWRVALAVHRRRPSHGFLAAAGVATVLAVLVTWILLVLVGWSLVFTSGEGAVRASPSGVPADLVERLYFTGYTVFTLGLGDFVPGDGAWQLATVAATGSGLVLVTLGITYLVPVASAVAERRSLAGYVSSLGADGPAILVEAWDGEDFGALSDHLVSLAPLLHTARQQHLTYPVLHYFHSVERRDAPGPAAVALSDALILLRHGVAPEATPAGATVRALDDAVARFLETVRSAHLPEGFDPLPPPSLQPLREAGIPTVDDDRFAAAVGSTERRRSLLAALLADDGWSRESGS